MKRKAFMLSLRTYPMQAIEVALASCLIIFGIYNMIPSEWLNVTTVYPAYAGKLIGGLSMLIPGVALVGIRSKGIMHYLRAVKYRKTLLMWLFIDYLYIGILRAWFISLFPPVFVLYIVLGVIAGICYLRLGIDEE
jgi:hypothetical protein